MVWIVRSSLVSAMVAVAATSMGSIVGVSSGNIVLANRPSNLLSNGSFEADAGNPNGAYWATGTSLTPTLALNSWTGAGLAQSYASWGNDGNGRKSGSALLPHGQNGVYFGASIMIPPAQTPSFAANGVVTWNATPVLQAKPGFGPVTLSQTLNGLSTSQTYLLDFWASGEGSGQSSFGSDGFFGLDITGESTTYLAAPSGQSNLGASQRYYVYFKPVSSSVTLTWTNWGHYFTQAGLSTELVLDDVIVNPVPEPSTLIAVGLGIGVLVRRRTRR